MIVGAACFSAVSRLAACVRVLWEHWKLAWMCCRRQYHVTNSLANYAHTLADH